MIKLALFFPCTTHEYHNKSIHDAIRRIVDANTRTIRKFDIFLIFNQGEDNDYEDLQAFSQKDCIQDIYIHSLNLNADEDIYIQPWLGRSLPTKMPKLGLSSGPNLSFYRGLEYVLEHENNYSHVLLLETDVFFLMDNSLDKIHSFCLNNQFSIAGSKYKGLSESHKQGPYKDHLNGVAIYSNTSTLREILKKSERVNQEFVKAGNHFLNFDIAIDIFRQLDEGKLIDGDHKFIDTDFIINCIDRGKDNQLTHEDVLRSFPNALILHQKITKHIHNTTLAIFYPCTLKEYKGSNLSNAISKILDNNPSDKFSFDLFLIFDQHSNDLYSSSFDQLTEHPCINAVYLHSLNIPPEDNIYIQPWNKDHSLPEVIPSHGLSSGPNQSFYQSLYYLINHRAKYDNFLLLETDIQILIPNWFDFLVDYCDNHSFTIAGSKYKGVQKWHRLLEYKDHLNGIALYKNSNDLLFLLQESEKHLIKQVKEGQHFLNFDIAIDQWIRTDDGQKFLSQGGRLVDVDFITNASDPEDGIIPKQTFLNQFPDTLILHHKTHSSNMSFNQDNINEESPQRMELLKKIKNKKNILESYSNLSNKDRVIPLFFHIPKNAGTFVISQTGKLRQSFRHKYASDPYFINRARKLYGEDFNCAVNLQILNNKDRPIAFIKGFDSEGFIATSRNIEGGVIKCISGIHHQIHLQNLTNEILSSVEIFQVNIVDRGFHIFEDILSAFDSSTGFIPHAFLRDPYSRALSMFNYLTSQASAHELTHKAIFANDFRDYICGIQCEDSWLMRNLLDIPNTEPLDDMFCSLFFEVFDLFKVSNINDTKSILDEVYQTAHNMSLADIKPELEQSIKKNKNANSILIQENELNFNQLTAFKKRAYYDYKIFERYIYNE
jgi:hypothetical protein